ncbi:Stp1/IreP family PP2C-type Ser/Thr phosphatase [Peptoniphilaceae bacterium SGI.131]
MKYYSLTNLGKVRKINQDNYANYISNKFSLFVVADGMGGHKAGDVAAKIAVEVIRDYVLSNKKDKDGDYMGLVHEAIKTANKAIFDMAKSREEYDNMGTTVVVCLIADNRAYVSHVGDSRLYIYRNKDFKQITKDHSYVQSLLDSGLLSDEEAKFYPNKNMITSALGLEEKCQYSSNYIDLQEKDILLLATDGLTDIVDDEEISDLLKLDEDLKEMAEVLIYMANSSGGYDNITVTLIKI